MKTYAVKAVDQTYRVQLGVYPLPENSTELTTVLSHIEAMPHTAEERTDILRVVAAHVSANFSKKDATEAFAGGLVEFKDEQFESELEAVEIALDEHNYALVYSAVQYAPGSTGPVSMLAPKAAEETGDTDIVESTEEVTAEAETEATEDTQESGDASETTTSTESQEDPLAAQVDALRVEFAAKLDAILETAKPKDPEVLETETPALSETERKLAEAETSVKKAVASSVALYMKTLKKPQARDKSTEALITELMAKSLDVLQDRLETLTAEAAAGPIATPDQLPTVSDPTLGTETDTPSSMDPSKLQSEIEESEDTDEVFIIDTSSALDELFKDNQGSKAFDAAGLL
jgi:hypothetical protein